MVCTWLVGIRQVWANSKHILLSATLFDTRLQRPPVWVVDSCTQASRPAWVTLTCTLSCTFVHNFSYIFFNFLCFEPSNTALVFVCFSQSSHERFFFVQSSWCQLFLKIFNTHFLATKKLLTENFSKFFVQRVSFTFTSKNTFLTAHSTHYFCVVVQLTFYFRCYDR